MKRLNQRVVVAGATGDIGASLIAFLNDLDVKTVALSRDDAPVSGTIKTYQWDGKKVGAWVEALNGARAVVNLSGSPLNVPWTPENRKRILDSRVQSACAIADGLKEVANPPRVWVNASAIGFYGDTGETPVEESSAAGKGFLSETCLAWEKAAEGATKIRIGAVLMKDAGFLKAMRSLVTKGLGGAAGSGRQWFSWIHVEDLCRLIWRSIEREDTGVFNGVSPNPVRNEDLMFDLRRAYGMPWSPPVPAFAVRLGAKLMRREADLVLSSARVMPNRGLETGFDYNFPVLRQALKDLTQ